MPLRLQPFRAIAVAAGPGIGAVPITAILAVVGVFDAEQFEIFLPIRPLFLQWRGAETGLNPMRGAVVGDAGLLHIVKVLITRH